ncbi:MAG: hypothetical protein A4E30_00317 [Methanomassiliicoccales archaeon PtaB.Bin215]|nr:MAG: hypothetical protein A4E30_00317 [Methanomassiliicoccales archaeon PtaB.Bin215]
MSDLLLFSYGNIEGHFEEMPDGSLLVHDVPLMVEGTWTAMDGRKIMFTPEDLRNNIQNWSDNAIWARHRNQPGENRPADQCLGGILNPRFEPNYKAVLPDGSSITVAAAVGDILLHRKTQASVDAATQIRLPKEAGGYRMVSSEIAMSQTEYDADSQTYRAIGYTWDGGTIQRKGACALCNIPAFASGVDDTMTKKKEEVTAPAPVNMAEEPPGEGPPPSTPGGGEGGEPAWVGRLEQKIDMLIEHERAEAQKGQGGEEAPVAQECNDKKEMAAPEKGSIDFSAFEQRIAAQDEEIRKLRATLDKINERPASTITEGTFSAGGEARTGTLSTVKQVGKSVSFRRGN